MTIKHLVISGGSYKGMYIFGALNYLSSINFYNIKNIENIYGSSVGGIIGLLLCLKLNLKDIIDQVINRPWQNLFNFTAKDILNIIPKRGLMDQEFIYAIFDNFFKHIGLNRESTFKDVYEYSKINLYLFTVNITEYKLEKMSHKSHPDIKILDAIYMGVTLPFIFQPLYINNCYYLDGGIINPYPLNICINDNNKKEEILAFQLINDRLIEIDKNASVFYFGFYLFYKLINKNNDYIIKNSISNEIIIPSVIMNIKDAHKIITTKSARKKLFRDGENYAKLFLKYKSKNNEKIKEQN